MDLIIPLPGVPWQSNVGCVNNDGLSQVLTNWREGRENDEI